MGIFDKNPPRIRKTVLQRKKSIFASRPKRESPEKLEMDRILKLPVMHMLEGDALEAACQELMLARPYEDGKRLFQTQASAIKAYDQHGGGFYPIGVGWGKTLITLAVADHAYVKGIRKILLLVPPSVLMQLVKVDIAWARKMIPISVPFHILGGRAPKIRKQMAESGRAGCYIMPYSLLSTSDSNEVIQAIDPDCIIADEAHQLKNRRTGKTKRLMHYINGKESGLELVAMSGTFTNKSISDYHHLITPALKENSPLPRTATMAFNWSRVIDSGSVIQSHAQTGPLLPLMRWAKYVDPKKRFKYNVSGFRDAYKLRLTTAPGVVATSNHEIGVSFGVENMPVPEPQKVEGWEDLQTLISQVQVDYKTPNGDEIEHEIHTFKWLFELAAGFYNELLWPTVEQLSKRRRIPATEAASLLQGAKQHHKAQQAYHKLLRTFLKDSPIGLDTPMEVARKINQDPAKIKDLDLIEAYWDMKNLEFDDMPERYRRAKRVCPYKIDWATKWAEQNKTGGIIWVYHQEVGKWLFESLEQAGLEPVYCPAGANDTLTKIGDPNRGGKGDRLVIASMMAHQIGKNLQAFQKQWFVQWPRDAKVAEQVLGRIHRNGQEADYIAAEICNTVPFDHVLFAACLNDAVYTHQSTGVKQKLVFATHNPLPMIFSPEFLREQGASPRILNAEQRSMLHDKFGEEWQDAAF